MVPLRTGKLHTSTINNVNFETLIVTSVCGKLNRTTNWKSMDGFGEMEDLVASVC